MTHILQFQKRKIAAPRAGVALPPEAAPGGPVLETTLHENLAVRKFLLFALADIEYQLKMLSTERGVSQKRFNEAKEGALLLANYVKGLLDGINAVIAQPVEAESADDVAG